MDNKQTQENVKLIISLVEPMKNNPKFAKLILYSLSTIKSIISLNEKQSVEAFSKLLLTAEMMEVFKDIFFKNSDNEEIVTKIGELLFCLIKLKQQEKKLKIELKTLSKNEIFSYVIELMSSLNQNFIQSYQIYIKLLQTLSSDDDISKLDSLSSSSNLYSVFSISLSLLPKLKDNQSIIIYLLETFKRLFLSEHFKLNAEDQIKLVSELNKIINDRINMNCNNNNACLSSIGLNNGNSSSTDNYNSSIVIRECFHLLKIIIHTHSEAKECYRNSKPISLILKVLTLNSETDNSLCFYCMQLLAAIIERKDIELFLRFLRETKYLNYPDEPKTRNLNNVRYSREKINTANFSLQDNDNSENLNEKNDEDSNDNMIREKEREALIMGILKEFQNPVSNQIEDNGHTSDKISIKDETNVNENCDETVNVNESNNFTMNNNPDTTKSKEELSITSKTIIFLRKSIAKVLIMIAKEPIFLKILGELNSIETLVELIQMELESVNLETEVEVNSELVESILPNFLKLVFTLISDQDNNYSTVITVNSDNKQSNNSNVNNSNSNNSNELFEKIASCLLKALVLLRHNKSNILEIIDILLTTKNQLLLDNMSKNFLKYFKLVYLTNYEENKTSLLITKINSIIQSIKRFDEVTNKSTKNTYLNKTTSGNNISNSSNESVLNYEFLIENVKNNYKKIQKLLNDYGIKKGLQSKHPNYNENIDCEYSKNNVDIDNSNCDYADVDINKPFNNNNTLYFNIPTSPEITLAVKSLKTDLISISYGMLYENSFPENLFHELCIFHKNLMKSLSFEIKLQGFSTDFEFIKVYINLIVISITNSKFGLLDQKINMLGEFLNYVLLEPGLNLTIHNFILKQIDFHLLPENKGLNKLIINNSCMISFITTTMMDYIRELSTGFNFRNFSSYKSNNQTVNSINLGLSNQNKSGFFKKKSSIITNSYINNIGSINSMNNMNNSNTMNSSIAFFTKPSNCSILIDDSPNNENKEAILTNNEITESQNNSNNINLESELLDNLLKYIINILKYHSAASFAQYIRENGVVMIIELCGIKIFEFEASKLIVKILQKFSSESLFRVSTQYFKNYIYSSKLISSLNEINFSKGINEKIYTEILVFFKNIYKNCDITEAIEEKHIIDHLVNELDQIYSFYMDTNNKVFEIILELVSYFSKEKILKRQLINSPLFMKLSQILKSIFIGTSSLHSISDSNTNYNNNDEFDFNEKIIDYLCVVIINFLKSREYSKMLYDTYYSVLELVKIISLKAQLSENTLTKLITLFQYIIDLEKQAFIGVANNTHSIDDSNTNSNIDKEMSAYSYDYLKQETVSVVNNNRLISTTFLTELLNKLTNNNFSVSLKQTVNKCISILSNENSTSNTVNSNINNNRYSTTSGLLSDLIYKSTSIYSAVNKLTSDTLDVIIKELPISFESLCQSVIFLLESLLDQDVNYNKENESEQLTVNLNEMSKVIEIISTLNNSLKHSKQVKNKLPLLEFTQKIYDLGIVDKIILLLSAKESQLKIVVDSSFTFLIKIEEFDKEAFYKNEKVYDFFIANYRKSFDDMANVCLIDNSNNNTNNTNNSNNNSNINSTLLYKKLEISLNFVDKVNIDLALSQGKPNLFELLSVNITVFTEKEKGMIEDFFEKISRFVYRIISTNYFKSELEKIKLSNNIPNDNSFNTTTGEIIVPGNSSISTLIASLFSKVFGSSQKTICEIIIQLLSKLKHQIISRNSKMPQFIFNLIELISFDESIVKEIINCGVLEFLNEYLNHCKSIKVDENIDQENLYFCLKVFETFSNYKFFCFKIVEQSTITSLNSVIELCLFLSLESKSLDDIKNNNNSSNESIKIIKNPKTTNSNVEVDRYQAINRLKTSINPRIRPRESTVIENTVTGTNNNNNNNNNNNLEELDKNTTIGMSILLTLKIFITAAKQEKKFCTIMGIYGVKETTLSILNFNSSNTFPIDEVKDLGIINKECSLLSLELLFLLLSDEYNLNFFRDPVHVELIIDYLKANIKDKDLTCLLLKIVNLLTLNCNKINITNINANNSNIKDNSSTNTNSTNNKDNINSTKKSSVSINSQLKEALDPYKMIEIINDLLDLYSTNYEITFQTCELISQFLNINEDQVVKDFLVSIIVNNFDRYSSKQEIVEMFLNSILTMLKKVRSLQQSDSTIAYDPSSVVYFTAKITNSSELKLNNYLYILIFRIIKQVSKYTNLASSLINEMFNIVKIIAINSVFQKDDELVLLFSRLFRLVCQVNTTDISSGSSFKCETPKSSANKNINFGNSGNFSNKNKISFSNTGSSTNDNNNNTNNDNTLRSSMIRQERNSQFGVGLIINNVITTVIDDPAKYLLFLLQQINKSVINTNSSNTNTTTFHLLEDYKTIILYFSLNTIEEKILNIFAEELILLYSKATNNKALLNKNDDENLSVSNDIVEKPSKSDNKIDKSKLISSSDQYNPKILTLILEIIGFMSLHNEPIKDRLIECNLKSYLEEFSNKSSIDPLLDYQIKATLVSLKKKKNLLGESISSKMTNNTNTRMSTISIQDNSFLFSSLKDDVRNFLKEERKVKIYTEKGEIKERFIMFNEGLDQIIAIKKDGQKIEIFDTMSIKDMDDCVRSCTTQAFSKSHGLFTKRVKSLRGRKTFNVECNKEEECIKYVDNISMLIQSFKNMGKDDSSNYGSMRLDTK